MKYKASKIIFVFIVLSASYVSAGDLSFYYRNEVARQDGMTNDKYAQLTVNHQPFLFFGRYRSFHIVDFYDVVAEWKFGKYLPKEMSLIRGLGIRGQYEYSEFKVGPNKSGDELRVYLTYRIKLWSW